MKTWFSDMKTWFSDMKTWFSDIKTWFSDMKTWFSDIQTWFSDMKTWFSDVRLIQDLWKLLYLLHDVRIFYMYIYILSETDNTMVLSVSDIINTNHINSGREAIKCLFY